MQECDSFCIVLQIRLDTLRPWHRVVIAAVRPSTRLTVQFLSHTASSTSRPVFQDSLCKTRHAKPRRPRPAAIVQARDRHDAARHDE